MKKFISFLCAALLVCGMSIPVLAEENETELTVSVPKQHTVAIESEGGRIVAGGAVCGNTVDVERHEEQIYWILPDAGKVLESLIYNGEDVTDQVKNGVFTAPALVRDADLTAVYANAPAAPDDKTYNVGGTVSDAEGIPLPGVTVDIGGKTDVTDENGRFDLADIPSGTHTVVITDGDGNVIGHGEITIDRGDDTDLTLTADRNGNPVVKPSTDTKNISLELVIGADGSIAVKSAADITPELLGFGVQTGDKSNLLVWSVMLLILSGMLLTMLLAKRQKKVERPASSVTKKRI